MGVLKEGFMRKLEKLKLKPAAGWEAERLSLWLYDWKLLQASDGVDEEGDKERPLDLLSEGSVAPMDDNIEVGQIRLLPPVASEGMVFIVVVSITEDGDVSFVPFGSLAEPATPDELLSGCDKAVVRVYCLWNLRKVSSIIAGNSWIVDRLDEVERDRLLRALDAIENDGCLPDDLLHDAGSDLVHPEDPRREYKNYERQRIDKAIAQKCNVTDNTILYDPNVKQEFLKAAESPENYET